MLSFKQTVLGLFLSIRKKMNVDFYFMLYTKINLKWFMELNKMAKIIQLLAENVSEGLNDTGLGKKLFRQDTESMIHKE